MRLDSPKNPIIFFSKDYYLYTINNIIMLSFKNIDSQIGSFDNDLYDIFDNTLVYFNENKLYIIDFLNNKDQTKKDLIEDNILNLIIIKENIYFVKYINERYKVFRVCKKKLNKEIIFSSKRRINLGKNNHYLHIIKSSLYELFYEFLIIMFLSKYIVHLLIAFI